MSGDSPILTLEAFEESVRRRKQGRWVRILAAEPVDRKGGRRPRDPAKEALLRRLDQARLEALRRAGDPMVPKVGASGNGTTEEPGGGGPE